MKSYKRSGEIIKFFIYLIVIILLNVAGVTSFLRIDLSSNKVYSLSDVSKKVVSTLEDPLTIYVFFTKNLPAPYNNIEKYLHDLLEEYSLSGNKYFNYRFYDVSPQDGPVNDGVRKNQELAESFGIRPIQLQVLDQDEFKFKMAYMGLAVIHGDMIERIPAISSSDRLEYQLTTSIQKLNNKISTFQKLKENIKLKLFLSSSLEKVAPLMGLEGFSEIPEILKETADRLNKKSFGKIEYIVLDPSKDLLLEDEVKKYSVTTLQWPAVPERSIQPGQGSIGIIIEYDGNALEIPLLERLQIPVLGAQQMNTIYQLADMEEIEETVQKSMESLIGINENIGYLADHGCINLLGREYNIPGMPSEGSISRFNEMASKTYSINEVRLADNDLLDGFNCLMVAGPKQSFNEYELFQIDQFLMKGKSIAFFLDSFEEVPSQEGGGGQYKETQTGLDKLLNHWGVNIKKSIVLDEDCYKAQLPEEYGGGEQPVYYVAQIRDELINKETPFMKNIRGLFVPMSSPVELDEKKVMEKGLTPHKLFSSSERSWEMKEPLSLNPMMMQPPGPGSQQMSIPLAYTIEGAFTSYFADKPIPRRVIKNEGKDEEEGDLKEKDKPAIEPDRIKSEEKKIDSGKPGKIFLIGTSDVLKNNVISPEGDNPNSIFIMNIIDYLNGREETAVMRGKTGNLNPLSLTSAETKSFIKYFNIAGLPVIVVIFGLCVWLLRHRRRLAIQELFKKNRGQA